MLLIATGLVGAVAFRNFTSALDHRRSLRIALNDLADVRLALSDQETGVRGFLLAGEDRFLGPYRDGLVREAVARDALASDAGSDPSVRDAISRTRDAADQWRTDAAEPEIASRRRSSTVDPALVDLGKQRFDAVRSTLDDLQGRLVRSVARADSLATHRQRIVVAIVVFGFIALLVGAAAIIARFRRWITRPLTEIGAAARSVGAGTPARFGTYAASELADVATAVDFLQRSLSEERDKALRSYETLQQSAVLALHVRSELAADQSVPLAEGWTTAATIRPAEGVVAGDCYDMGLVSPHLAYVVVIDVTGHGPVAALNALRAKSLLRTALKSGVAPGEAVGWLVRHASPGDELEYLTCFAAQIELESGVCRYANAGHPPAYVVAGVDEVTELGRTGPLVGPFDATWQTDSVRLPIGSTLVICTDGLTESLGADRGRLGEQAVVARLAAGGAGSAQATLDALEDLVDAHRVGPAADDVTIVAIAHGPRVMFAPDRQGEEPERA